MLNSGLEKKSLADLLLKEAVTSGYGKTAQDVIDKSSWSASKEMMVDIGGSPITSPYHATMTTTGVRCVLLAAMNQLEDLGYKVYSVTTDGFITNAPENVLVNLDLYGFTKRVPVGFGSMVLLMILPCGL